MKGQTPRNRGLVRVLSILRTIERGNWIGLDALADEYRVSTRTIRRDLDTLEAAGYPLRKRESPNEPSFWKLERETS